MSSTSPNIADTATTIHYNTLSSSARQQRDKDIALQQRALEILKDKLGDRILDATAFRKDITITIGPEALREALTELRDNSELQFDHLASVTGVDYSRLKYPGSWGDIRFGIIYNIFSYPNSANFTIRVVVPEDVEVPSVFDMWHGVDWQEREIYDLLGVRFNGHPDLRRLFLYDDFEDEYPLRKDYPLRGKGERDRSWRHVKKQAESEGVLNPSATHAGWKYLAKPPDSQEGTIWVNFGPQHPSAHGTLHLMIEIDGETIVQAVPHIGYLHCGFEKLGEHRNYNHFVTIADRMNYLSPICNDVGWSLTCEKLFDIPITERCAYIRVITAELSRIADHLFATGMQAVDLGAFSWFLFGFQHREEIYDILERCCGQRLTTSYTRIGGLLRDMDDTAVAMTLDLVKRLPKTLDNMENLLLRNKIWTDRTFEIGQMSYEEAINWGLTGPCLRAAGVPHDVRKDDPYLVYDQFDFDIPIGSRGDVFDRWNVRMEEMRQSARIVEQACKKLPKGPINTDDTRYILPPKDRLYDNIENMIIHFKQVMFGHGAQPPAGEVYCRTEAPNGELGYYIVSDGSEKPYRVHVRSPSLVQFSSIVPQLDGRMISDTVAIMGSLNIIAGELDR